MRQEEKRMTPRDEAAKGMAPRDWTAKGAVSRAGTARGKARRRSATGRIPSGEKPCDGTASGECGAMDG